MTLTHILIFSLAALLYAAFLPARWRGWALLIASVVAIYWLQPALPVRNLDFLLPTTTLVLAVAGWLATKPAPTPTFPPIKREGGASRLPPFPPLWGKGRGWGD